VGVLALDLDNFRDVGDTLGHAEADALLEQVAERLRRAAGPDDLLARLGGDDFGLLAPGADGASMLELAICVRAALDEPFAVAGLRLGVSASVGVAWTPEHGDDAEALLRRAEVAMYRAKLRRTGTEAYDPAIDRHSAERLVLAAELREGIARGELLVHYQPQLELATGDLAGVEALVRWRHPRRGLIPPAEFIELAERTDVIGALTMSVLRTALGQAAAWRDVGLNVPVAVNLPAQMLLDVNLPGDVASLLARFGLEGGSLVLEITEGSLIHDPHRSAQILDSLSAMGVRIAIDDYGSGYSSLAWLKRFPVDELKIRSLVRHRAGARRERRRDRSLHHRARPLARHHGGGRGCGGGRRARGAGRLRLRCGAGVPHQHAGAGGTARHLGPRPLAGRGSAFLAPLGPA
jgi:diguanylate cyclase (GGDEF)-like protein